MPAGLGRRRTSGSRVWPEGSCWWRWGGWRPPLHPDLLTKKQFLWEDQKKHDISLFGYISGYKPPNKGSVLTHLSQLGVLCGAWRWWSPLQPPLGCTWWSSCVQEWPCWVWAECPLSTHDGLTWPCTLQPGPATQTPFYQRNSKVIQKSHRLVHNNPHLLSDVLAAPQVMITIRQNLRLYDGHNAVLVERRKMMTRCTCVASQRCFLILSADLLADTRVACENIRIFSDSQFWWIDITDFEHTAPLCKDGAILFVLRTPLGQSVQTCGENNRQRKASRMENDGWYQQSSHVSLSDPVWWFLHRFPAGGQRLCPPEKLNSDLNN